MAKLSKVLIAVRWPLILWSTLALGTYQLRLVSWVFHVISSFLIFQFIWHFGWLACPSAYNMYLFNIQIANHILIIDLILFFLLETLTRSMTDCGRTLEIRGNVLMVLPTLNGHLGGTPPSVPFNIHNTLKMKSIYNLELYIPNMWRTTKLLGNPGSNIFLVGDGWRCTLHSPFRLGLSTPSTTSTLQNNFWQTCWLRLFCYNISGFYTNYCNALH